MKEQLAKYCDKGDTEFGLGDLEFVVPCSNCRSSRISGSNSQCLVRILLGD